MLKSGRMIFLIYNCDILVYFLQYCAWDEKRLKEHKHDNGFKLYNANHISGVQLANISTDFSYIKGFCVPETRLIFMLLGF